MTNQEKDQKILRWLNQEIDDSQLENVWSENELHAYRQIIGEIDQWVPDNDQRIFDSQTITRERAESKVIPISRWIPVSIAASILIAALAGWYFFATTSIVHHTGLAEIKTIQLPDQASDVTLDTNSEISWNEEDWTDGQRSLRLKGKAFFSVSTGNPFVVNTENGSVEVLGTEFEVDVFRNSLYVAVNEGVVRATSTSGQDITLKAGEGSQMENGLWKDKVNVVGLPKWLSGDGSSFINAPLKRVLATLERQYNIEIKTNGIDLDRKFTGSFPHDDLEVAVKIITQPLDLSYEIRGSVLILSEQ